MGRAAAPETRPRPPRWRGAICAAALACLAACAPPPEVSTAEDEAAIAEFNRQYLAAINGADLDHLARLTTEGHMMINSGGAPLVGKQALVDAMRGAFARFEFDESWSPEETVVDGDLAYQRGTFVVNATPKSGGQPTRTTGNFLRIYRREPEGWFMVRDMFNSAQPAAAEAPRE
jgi:ketosteroid isomerase-like protein